MSNCYLCRGKNAEIKPFDYGRKRRVLCMDCVPYAITEAAIDKVSSSRARVRKQLIEMVENTNTEDKFSLLYSERDPNYISCSLGGEIGSDNNPLSIDVSYSLSKKTMSDVNFRRKQRNDLLVEIYEVADGVTNGGYDIDSICQALNMDIDTARQICVFWSKKGCLDLVLSGSGMITQEGIEEAEIMLEGDVISSAHTLFQTPSNVTNNTIHITDSTLNGSIQQGSVNTIGSVTYDREKLSQIQSFTNSTIKHIDELGLAPDDYDTLLEDIHAVDRELRSNNPNTGLIAQGLQSCRNIIEGVTGSMIATGLLKLLEVL